VTTVKTRKKLIEVALPLEAINVASAREKSIRHGHPSTLHLYWARRPLATARAVIFAQMVDDPSANPELFPTEAKQNKERQRLFRIIENLVKWENTTNQEVLQAAREEIWQSWRRACADNADHPRAKELFDRNKLPAFHDPFAGGGALPLEAQRLGLESYATDLNPVAVMINKAMIEIPPKFSCRPPVNPAAHNDKSLIAREWNGAQGLAEDLRYYGQWIRDEAYKRIGHLYPKVRVTAQMAKVRPDLNEYVDTDLTVIAWLWARTVRSPNPPCANVDVPLASTFYLSTKEGKEVYVEPHVSEKGYSFTVKVGKPKNPEVTKNGTKLSRGANFKCVMSGVPIHSAHVYSEGKAGRLGAKLMAIVAEGPNGRIYLSPILEHEEVAKQAKPAWRPEATIADNPRAFSPPLYGMKTYADIFTNRQLCALTTFSALVGDARELAKKDAIVAGLKAGQPSLEEGGLGAAAYAEAVAVYLAFAVSKMANIGSTVATWMSDRGAFRETFARQAIPMTWDFAEANTFADLGGSFSMGITKGAMAMDAFPANVFARATQDDASTQTVSAGKVISTDPPYYDNIGYADLSDFFYVWLHHSLSGNWPKLFSTLATPKDSELVASPYRHGGKDKAEKFFLDGMTHAMHRLSEQAHPHFPITIYYAFRQTENETEAGASSTGWETFLDAVITAGFSICGTWPMRTEGSGRMVAKDANALASSIVLVCRKRDASAATITRSEFIDILKSQLPLALGRLQEGNIAPVDLAQAAIGPGIAIYTSYSKIIGADGSSMGVKDALTRINEVLDEKLAEQENNWDADTRWASTWFDQYGFASGEFGLADQLARAKNTSVNGVVLAGIAASGAGKVKLLKPEELPAVWAPETDERLTVWEMLHHLIRLQKQGEAPAAAMLARLGGKADAAKELAYRLYGICERKKRSSEGQFYNDLIVVWPDLVSQSKQAPTPTARPGEFELDA